MAKKSTKKRPMRWLHSEVPVHHGLTIEEATTVANRLMTQQRREGFSPKLVKGRLKFVVTKRNR